MCICGDEVAQAAENQRAERPDKEAGGEGEKRKDVARGLGILAEEGCTDINGKRTVKIEIIPFEDGTSDEAKMTFFSSRSSAGFCAARCHDVCHFDILHSKIGLLERPFPGPDIPP